MADYSELQGIGEVAYDVAKDVLSAGADVSQVGRGALKVKKYFDPTEATRTLNNGRRLLCDGMITLETHQDVINARDKVQLTDNHDVLQRHGDELKTEIEKPVPLLKRMINPLRPVRLRNKAEEFYTAASGFDAEAKRISALGRGKKMNEEAKAALAEELQAGDLTLHANGSEDTLGVRDDTYERDPQRGPVVTSFGFAATSSPGEGNFRVITPKPSFASELRRNPWEDTATN
ncbi:hypothetical protein PsYK624_089550 [Phanerochaete sordida]|uniref:Uncharacterized protein n=1 Tax=Phanerochaete sordida TaxID=48140 RepID=A0A9P3GDB1_9APHY|nr:hypothetical protein PsYK624_089550 [Phanerochaete sordida]